MVMKVASSPAERTTQAGGNLTSAQPWSTSQTAISTQTSTPSFSAFPSSVLPSSPSAIAGKTSTSDTSTSSASPLITLSLLATSHDFTPKTFHFHPASSTIVDLGGDSLSGCAPSSSNGVLPAALRSQHARITLSSGELLLQDLGDGDTDECRTQINGEPVYYLGDGSYPIHLRDGDELRFGHYDITQPSVFVTDMTCRVAIMRTTAFLPVPSSTGYMDTSDPHGASALDPQPLDEVSEPPFDPAHDSMQMPSSNPFCFAISAPLDTSVLASVFGCLRVLDFETDIGTLMSSLASASSALYHRFYFRQFIIFDGTNAGTVITSASSSISSSRPGSIADFMFLIFDHFMLSHNLGTDIGTVRYLLAPIFATAVTHCGDGGGIADGIDDPLSGDDFRIYILHTIDACRRWCNRWTSFFITTRDPGGRDC
ncbi:hypothetical protein CF326_g9044 [Tilletia indica]|nr:hypothetical protein CF326_g9044 [Tilletia indica]